MQHWFAESEAGVQAQLYAALIGYRLTQVLLLWAAEVSGLPATRLRFATVLSLVAQELTAQFKTAALHDFHELIASIIRNATIPESETQRYHR